MVRYLTGASNKHVKAVCFEKNIGLLVTLDTKGYSCQIDEYPFWAADNACFNHPDDFSLESYMKWLGSLPMYQRDKCLFAPAPDVVGDPVKTLGRSLPVLPMIRDLGYRAALVAQDGIEHLDIPWDEFDVLFIGGSTEWKLSEAARALCSEAKVSGKGLHMGRVNSYKRLKIANDFGCDTADGTYLAFGPIVNLPKLCNWLDKLRQEAK